PSRTRFCSASFTPRSSRSRNGRWSCGTIPKTSRESRACTAPLSCSDILSYSKWH
ncbi:hypothetical protein BGZ52_000203, partial [Haplosporangium bisporale]